MRIPRSARPHVLALAALACQVTAQEAIDMQFRDARIADIVRTLGDHYGVSILMSGSIDGTVTIAFDQLPIGQALDNLLEGTDYTWLEQGGVYRVVPRSTNLSRMFPLRYTDATDLAAILQTQLSAATVTAEPHSNSLLIRGPITDLEFAARVVAETDRYRSQVRIRAEMIEVTLTDVDVLGVDLSALLSGVDGRAGFMSGWSDGNDEARFDVGTIQGDVDVSGVLAAIRTDREATLLSSPEITTLDNTPARIHVGERVPYQRAQLETESGALLAEIEFMDVGVKLDVTPTISDDGLLYLQIHGEISEVLDQSVQNVPRIGTREADTRVLVRDGHTVVIAGLMRDNLVTETRKVPLLGDIPLLGRLFRRDRTDKTKTEFLIFIYPRIIPDPMDLVPTEAEAAVRGRVGDR